MSREKALLVKIRDARFLDHGAPVAREDGPDHGIAHHLQVEGPGAAAVDDPAGGLVGFDRDARECGGVDQEADGVCLGKRAEVDGGDVVREGGAGGGGCMAHDLGPVPGGAGEEDSAFRLGLWRGSRRKIRLRFAEVTDFVEKQDGGGVGAEAVAEGVGGIGGGEARVEDAGEIGGCSEAVAFQGGIAGVGRELVREVAEDRGFAGAAVASEDGGEASAEVVEDARDDRLPPGGGRRCRQGPGQGGRGGAFAGFRGDRGTEECSWVEGSGSSCL